MFRKFSALLDVFALIVSPAAGFDSYWHAQCSQKVGEQFGFTQDAWKATRQLLAGFFGPVSEHVSKKIQGKELEALNQFQANSPQIRGAAIFLHFDNLNNDFQSNANFDYVFNRLLQSTQNLTSRDIVPFGS